MQLQQIDLNKLKTTPLNVRKQGAKHTGDLVTSIRSLGLIQPLLVRPNGQGYEVIAGQRRFHALSKLAEDGMTEPVPCLVMDKGDDAKAVEASLAENIARLPMDEIDQYKAFAALVKQGQDIASIANRFGITEKLVRQRLAIANLMAPVLTAYRKGKIHPTTVRILTMATQKQQKAWYALLKGDGEQAPEDHRLKSWLFGGANISTDHALFDVKTYTGNIIADLFGEERYFDDSENFWTLQNQAIADMKARYLADGWNDVMVLDIGEYFPAYEYVDTSKGEGGKVYITASHSGEVTAYEGQLSRKEAKAKLKAQTKANGEENGNETSASIKPELTKPMQNYLDLHRHAAVRKELLAHTAIALRLAVAQMIAGSELWDIKADPQKSSSEAISESLASNQAEVVFAEERQQILALLNIGEHDNDTLVCRKDDWGKSHDIHTIFARLITLSDEDVNRILAFVVAETLSCGSDMVGVLGNHLEVDMTDYWQVDQTFFDLLRDKQAINAILKQRCGKATADAHIASTAKVQKQVIQRALEGKRTSKAKTTDWKPNYLAFPMKAYTKQGGIRAVEGWKAVRKHYQ